MNNVITATYVLDPKDCGHSFWTNGDGDPECEYCGYLGHICDHERIKEHCEFCADPEPERMLPQDYL